MNRCLGPTSPLIYVFIKQPIGVAVCWWFSPTSFELFLSTLKNKQTNNSMWTFLFQRRSGVRKPHENTFLTEKFTVLNKNLNPSDYIYHQNCIRLEIIPIFPWPWQVSRKKLYNLESSNAGHVGIIQRLYLRNICCIHLFLRSTRIKIDILKRKKERKSMIVGNKLKLSEKKIHSIKF